MPNMNEVVDHGRTGLLFAMNDPDDLADKVSRLLADPARLKEMRREARAEFEAKYTAERNYTLLMRIYERAMKERSGDSRTGSGILSGSRDA
jgi:glycosyltransferase involved in cell wall biosynthesis